jgi:DNA-binding transcriptional MocR family regulator
MENPTYIGAIDAFRTTGNRLLPVPVDRDGLRVEVVGMLAGGAPLRLAYVVPTFHNPTAVTMPEDRRRELVRLAGEYGFQVVEDLTPDASLGRDVPPPLAAFDPSGERVITIGSLSKVAWGGLRIGWVRASRADIDRIVAGKIVADHSTSLITQAIAARVLDRVDEVAAATEAAAGERRAVLTEALRRQLPDWGWSMPGGGLALWVRLPDADAVAFSRLAAEHGVIVRPGPLASPDGGFRDHIRIAYGAAPDQLRLGVDRLADAWAAYVRSARPARRALAVSV